MRTHFLDFKISGKDYRLKVTEQFFNTTMQFWLKNPTYQEKLEVQIDAREQHEMVFTMANFIGVGGKLPPNKEEVFHVMLPESKEDIERRRKAFKKYRKKWRDEGKHWELRTTQKIINN